MKRNNNTFYEYQQLKRWLIFPIFIPVNLILITGCFIQIVLGKPLGNNLIPDNGLIILSISMLLFMVILLFINLKTVIDTDGIYIRMQLFPFCALSKFFFWEEISEIQIIRYSPFRMGGGYKYRIRINNISLGKMRLLSGINTGFISITYTIYGNKGIRFVYKNKKSILIGTNNPEGLSEALRNLGKSESNKE